MTRDELLTLYEDLIARHDGLALRGKANPYTAMNGNMFSFLGKDDALALRFDEPRRKALAAEFGTGDVVSYGAVMKGYVALPVERLDRDRMQALFAEAVRHAATLPPNPAKR